MTDPTDLIARLNNVDLGGGELSGYALVKIGELIGEAKYAIESTQGDLAEAVKYVHHYTDCEWVDYGCRGDPNKHCTCGASAVLAKHKEQP